MVQIGVDFPHGFHFIALVNALVFRHMPYLLWQRSGIPHGRCVDYKNWTRVRVQFLYCAFVTRRPPEGIGRSAGHPPGRAAGSPRTAPSRRSTAGYARLLRWHRRRCRCCPFPRTRRKTPPRWTSCRSP